MLPIMDNNELIYNMGKREVLPQVKEVPVIAGVAGQSLPSKTRTNKLGIFFIVLLREAPLTVFKPV